MKQTYRKWSKLILLGTADLDAGNVEKAIAYYERAQTVAERLIDDTIMTFDGDISPQNLYNHTCCCLVTAHQQIGDSVSARSCLMQTGHKFLAVLNSTSYPILMRGNVIRAFEPLFDLAIRFHRTEGRPDEAYAWVGDWLTEVKRYVSRTRPFEEAVRMN